MSDVITGLRQVIQDLVAPDLKAILSRQDSLQKQLEVQHDAVVKTIEAFRAEMRSGVCRAPAKRPTGSAASSFPFERTAGGCREKGFKK